MSLERTDGGVIRLNSGAETRPRATKVPRESDQPSVQLLTELTNGRRVLRNRRLSPSIRNGFQQSNQRRRCRDDHILLERRLEQIAALSERSCKELIAG